jgi:hypothetical protein
LNDLKESILKSFLNKTKEKIMNYKLNLTTDGKLIRNVDSTKHYFIKFRAYGFDESELLKYKGKWHTMEIKTSAGKTYTISESEFYSKSLVNEDFGKVQRLIGVRFLNLDAHTQTFVKVDKHFHVRLKKTSRKENKPMNQVLIDLFNKNYGN